MDDFLLMGGACIKCGLRRFDSLVVVVFEATVRTKGHIE